MTDNKRPPEPEFLRVWREIRQLTNAVPKCCHTCEHYSRDGICNLAGVRPPDDFVSYGSAECPDFSDEVPF
jgi:hypothetical protein